MLRTASCARCAFFVCRTREDCVEAWLIPVLAEPRLCLLARSTVWAAGTRPQPVPVSFLVYRDGDAEPDASNGGMSRAGELGTGRAATHRNSPRAGIDVVLLLEHKHTVRVASNPARADGPALLVCDGIKQKGTLLRMLASVAPAGGAGPSTASA